MITIHNLTNFVVSEVFLKRVAKVVLKGENVMKKELSVVLVKPEEIKKVNNIYRKKNKPTDVLSFEGAENNLGEVLICPSVVKGNSEKNKLNFQEEISFVLIHGILHLLGYDHEGSKAQEKKMEQKQEYYLTRI
ncbi:MAG: rRNA maturation RNase YbeY [Candidatus Staskawiczbacteria bacterium]|jgi:probable rRNA maturation factor